MFCIFSLGGQMRGWPGGWQNRILILSLYRCRVFEGDPTYVHYLQTDHGIVVEFLSLVVYQSPYSLLLGPWCLVFTLRCLVSGV